MQGLAIADSHNPALEKIVPHIPVHSPQFMNLVNGTCEVFEHQAQLLFRQCWICIFAGSAMGLGQRSKKIRPNDNLTRRLHTLTLSPAIDMK